MTTKTKDLFFELLKVTVGALEQLSRSPSASEWEEIKAEAERQSVVGVMLDGLERLPQGVRPPQLLLLQWIGEAQIEEQKNQQMTEASKDIVAFFQQNGFACTLLKGAAVGRYYSNPSRRASGDVDIWVNGNRKKIYDFARRFDKDGKLYGVTYHHIHFHLIDKVHIEVHIWPSFLCNPFHNKKFHKFCMFHKPIMEDSLSKLGFDRVFILLHCYRHMCGRGVGLRQIMDYFYVLKQGFTEEEKRDSVGWIKKLGMERFAGGIMWVLLEMFGLEKQYLLLEPDKKEGRFILQEVLMAGNMGHGDMRKWGSQKTPVKRFFHNLKRDGYLISHYPQEIICQPFFSIWLYLWRRSKGLI